MRSSGYLLVVAVILGIFCGIRYCSSGAGYVEETPSLFEGFIPENAALVFLGRPDLDKMEQAEAQAKAEKREFQGDPLQYITEPIQVIKENTKWRVVMPGEITLPAAQNQVEDLLKAVAGIPATRSDIVSEQEEDHEAYQVDAKHALHVVVKGKNDATMAHLLVGRKPEPGEDADYTASQGRFVRKADEPFVIHYGKQYWNLEEKRENWLDKQVLTFERDQVERIVVKNKKGGWTLERDGEDDSKWRLVAPIEGPAKENEVAIVLNNFANLYFDHYVGPKTPQVLARCQLDANASYVVTFEMKEEGVKHILRVGANNPEKEGQVFGLVEAQPFVFSMGKHLTEPLRQEAEKLLDKPEKKPAEEPGGGAPGGDKPGDKPEGEPGGEPGDKPGEGTPGDQGETGGEKKPKPEDPGAKGDAKGGSGTPPDEKPGEPEKKPGK